MRLQRFLFAAFAGLLFGNIFSGNIVDEKTGKPLVGVNVVVIGEGKGASSDLDGNFFVPNLEEGSHNISISMVGYRSDTMTIVMPDETFHRIALAQDVKTFQPVVVTANRQKQNLQESPVTVTVLEQEDIKSQAMQRMEDVLKTAPGITKNRESMSLRNCSGYTYGVGSRVLVMVDGIPLLTGDTGQPKWDAIDAGSVKQVEIVKNSGSALYGSNAMGGVINVITKDPEEGIHFKVETDFGIWDEPYYEEWRWSDKTRMFQRYSVGNTYRRGPLSTSLTFTTNFDDSYRQTDHSYRGNLLGKLKYATSARTDYLVHMNVAYEDRGQYLDWLNTEHALETDPDTWDNRIWNRKISLAGIHNHRNIEKKYFVTTKAYTFVHDFDSQEYDSENSSDMKHRWATTSKSGIDGQINFANMENQSLTTGAEVTAATVNSTLFGARYGYGGAVYVQDELSHLHPLVLSAGGRFDFFTVKDAKSYYQFNPKAGLVYHLAENIALRSSVGSGYRVPTLAELFTQVRVAGLVEIRPNPDLNAEKSYSAEIGGNIITRSVSFDVALFSNWYNDLIEPIVDEGSTSQGQFKNIRSARVMGTELTANYNRGPFTLNVNYLYTSSDDLDNDKPLPYRPDHNFTINGKIRYFRDIASISGAWRYKSKRLYSLYPDAPSVPEKVLDLGHSLNFGKYYFNFKVNNVLQYHYSEAEKGIEDIRNFVVSAGVNF